LLVIFKELNDAIDDHVVKDDFETELEKYDEELTPESELRLMVLAYTRELMYNKLG
jgi:hypothetical protein